MAKPELERSGLLTIDRRTGRVDYRQLFGKALQLLKHDDERYLYIAQKLDALIAFLKSDQSIERAELLLKLEEIADYSRVVAAQPPRYRSNHPSDRQAAQDSEECIRNGYTGC